MAVIINAYDFKCFNQLKNDDDFLANTSDYTTNLVGNPELLKVNFLIDLTWYSDSSSSESWTMFKDGSTGSIIRKNVFKDTDVAVGDSVDFYADWINRETGILEFTATIDFISTDNQLIEFTVTSGTQATVGEGLTNVGIWADPDNSLNHNTAAYFKFGLVENDEENDNISKVTDNEQAYYSQTPISRTFSVFSPLIVQGSYKDFDTGSAEIALNNTTKRNTDTFEVNHIFMNPFYTSGQLPNLQNNEIIDLLKGSNSLKYAFEVTFQKTDAQVSTAKTVNVQNIDGYTGWFNENFNGKENKYTLTSILYQDNSDASTVDSVLISGETKITLLLDRTGNFISGQKIGVFIAYLPDQDSEFKNTTTDLGYNFMLDYISHTEGTAASTGVSPFGNGVFNTCEATETAGSMGVVITLDYTVAQANRISGGNYLLWVILEDGTLFAPSSDRVSLICDTNTFKGVNTADTSALLMDFDTFNILRHDQQLGIDTGAVGVTAWPEDNVVLDFDFWLENTLNSVITELKFKLTAYNSVTGNEFELDTYTINLSNVVVSGGVQQIEIDTTRAYILAVGDQFNYVKVTTGALVGSKQHYTGSFGQKISWARWIKNLQADTIFYDNAEPQDNLNFKASNYSNLEDYDIKITSVAQLTGDDAIGVNSKSSFTFRSDDNSILNYGVSSDGTVSALRYTLTEDGLTDLGGKILSNQNTLFRIVWVKSGVALVDVDFAIMRAQPSGSLGNDIHELSSLNARLVGDLLKPIDGETLTKNTLVGSDIHSECLIDYTKLKDGVEYDLSGKIEIASAINAFWSAGVCEVEAVIIVEPTPSVPDFCNSIPVSSGGFGLFDKKYIMTYSGIMYLVFNPWSAVDKIEILVNSETVVTATSGTDPDGNYGDTGLGFDPDTGVNIANDNIWDVAFDANNERVLVGPAKTLSTAVWMIGTSIPVTPSRTSQFETDTGTILTSPAFIRYKDQIVWCSVQAGDSVIVRVTGGGASSGTLWDFNVYCIME